MHVLSFFFHLSCLFECFLWHAHFLLILKILIFFLHLLVYLFQVSYSVQFYSYTHAIDRVANVKILHLQNYSLTAVVCCVTSHLNAGVVAVNLFPSLGRNRLKCLQNPTLQAVSPSSLNLLSQKRKNHIPSLVKFEDC